MPSDFRLLNDSVTAQHTSRNLCTHLHYRFSDLCQDRQTAIGSRGYKTLLIFHRSANVLWVPLPIPETLVIRSGDSINSPRISKGWPDRYYLFYDKGKPLTRSTIMKLSGCSRQAINSAISRMKQKNLVTISEKTGQGKEIVRKQMRFSMF